MATDGVRREVERYTRPVRWFHAAVYVTVLLLLGTGWWLALGREGQPSPLARLTGQADVPLHVWGGWALTVVVVAGPALGARSAATFLRESVRFRRADLTWLRGWPRGAFTGRFARHEGDFDPGQRIANIALTVLLAALVVSGVGMARLDGGPVFAALVHVHRWATWAATPLLAGHVLVAAGLLPGYRGVWRSMHLGGHLDARVAKRLWPAWAERHGGGTGAKGRWPPGGGSIRP